MISIKLLNKGLPFLPNLILILSETTVTQILSDIELTKVYRVSDAFRPVVLLSQVVLDNLSLFTVTL